MTEDRERAMRQTLAQWLRIHPDARIRLFDSAMPGDRLHDVHYDRAHNEIILEFHA